MADTSASGADDSNIVQVQVLLSAPAFGFAPYRGVAQFGRALRSGRRGRGFKSRHLDQFLNLTNSLVKRFVRFFVYAFVNL